MGFEKLAELKKQLQAAAQPEPKRKPRQPGKPKPVSVPPVDPVLHYLGRLQKLFPKTFPKNPAPKVPLKVGILEDLVARKEEIGLDEARLKEALSKLFCAP